MKLFPPISALTLATAAATSSQDINNGLLRRKTQTTSCTDQNDCNRRNEFCGTDGQCHGWSCDSWFQLGPWTKIGNVDLSTVSLTCESYTTGIEDNLHAVVFGCKGHGPGSEIPDGEGYSQVFNQKCQADLGQQNFECYHLAPDTDFSSFVSQAESSSPKACDYTAEQVAAGSPTHEDYGYQVNLQEDISNGGQGTITGPTGTATLDTDLAMLTMCASVTEKTPGPTPSPTSSDGPSTLTPTPENTSGAHILWSTTSVVIASVGTFLLTMLV